MDKINELEHSVVELIDGVVHVMNKINEFENLKENWDGRNAKPVSERALKNLLRLLKTFPDLSKWSVFPGVNGDIFLVYKGDNYMSNIVILPNNKFSYFTEGENELHGGSNIKFGARYVRKLMKDIETGKLVD